MEQSKMMLNIKETIVPNRYVFMAMNSPCEVQFDCENTYLAEEFGRLVEEEAARIETKYSRYKSDSMLSKINMSNGLAVEVDAEMMALLQYANSCYNLSDGQFDITSGVLRRIWRFDGSNKIPKSSDINALLPLIGWDKVTLGKSNITLLEGMEIDFGGLGKEYAVDSAFSLVAKQIKTPFLVNFGGDLRVSGPRHDGSPWKIAIEAVDQNKTSETTIGINRGALTTSGDARRFIMKNGKRYGHILNPLTGRPVMGAPRSITIAASNCLEAGVMSTLAMAKGRGAEQFVKEENLRAWITR
jgi:FAD:protein FMN transferase